MGRGMAEETASACPGVAGLLDDLGDNALLAQVLNLGWRQPEFSQHLARVFSQTRRTVPHDHWRAEARGSTRLPQATGGRMVALEHDAAGKHLGVTDDLMARQHRRE